DLRRAARRRAKRRPQRGHAQDHRRSRGADSALPRAVLVDPQALQEPTRAAAQSVRRGSAGGVTAMQEPTAGTRPPPPPVSALPPGRCGRPRDGPPWSGLLAIPRRARLPSPGARASGGVSGRLLPRFKRRENSPAARTLEICSPELAPAGRAALLDRHFEAVG